MINELIPIFDSKFNSETIKTVNARDLHKFLEVKNYFREWIKDRITKYNFIDGVDYVKIIENVSQNLCAESTAASESTTYEVTKTGQGRIDYHISIDMAKELAMVERNTKGKEARQYFINCEKELMKKKYSDPTSEELESIEWLESYREIVKIQQHLIEKAIEKEKKILSLKLLISEKDKVLEKYKLEVDEGLIFVSEFSNQVGIGVVKFGDILKQLDIVKDSSKTVTNKYSKYFSYTLTYSNNRTVLVLKVNSDGLVLLDDLVHNGLFQIVNLRTNQLYDGDSINKLKRTEIVALISGNQNTFDNILNKY